MCESEEPGFSLSYDPHWPSGCRHLVGLLCDQGGRSQHATLGVFLKDLKRYQRGESGDVLGVQAAGTPPDRAVIRFDQVS